MARSLPAPQRVAGTLHARRAATPGATCAAPSTRCVRRRPWAPYLASHPVARLNVGAGGALLDGWLNTDRDPGPGAVYLDITRRFPLPDASVQRVLVEHVIEHVPLEAGRHMPPEASTREHSCTSPGPQRPSATTRRLSGSSWNFDGDPE
jgi:hypothetical protein